MNRDDQLLGLFMHEGWKAFQTEMSEGLELIKASAWQCPNEQELFRVKGQIHQLALVVNFEELTKARIDEDLRAEKGDDAL